MIAVLHTIGCTVNAPLKERLGELESLYGQYNVHTTLRNKRSNAWFEKRREQYCGLIRKTFDEFRQILGTERIRTILVQHDHRVSKEYIAKLMKEIGLSSIRSTTKQDYMKLHSEICLFLACTFSNVSLSMMASCASSMRYISRFPRFLTCFPVRKSGV